MIRCGVVLHSKGDMIPSGLHKTPTKLHRDAGRSFKRRQTLETRRGPLIISVIGFSLRRQVIWSVFSRRSIWVGCCVLGGGVSLGVRTRIPPAYHLVRPIWVRYGSPYKCHSHHTGIQFGLGGGGGYIDSLCTCNMDIQYVFLLFLLFLYYFLMYYLFILLVILLFVFFLLFLFILLFIYILYLS